ncbi:RxLR-like protein [Plasmopara halstedii]|uniref:RxLR-like protein n=1 Tax=Plasmopara halstedii TaxID=4781 RepID=A0A0P1A5Q1_PLAHL|nr:RxLR-like protein [Plasmopara halstedii]CEG35708.1 RxLR-like protein [Plasmopara halstedii]|eukprot:XP_024572077.1 RxLR-like protein [Plasmopara halstedii]
MTIARTTHSVRRKGIVLLIVAVLLVEKSALKATSDTPELVIVAPDKRDEAEEREYAKEQQELREDVEFRDQISSITTDTYSFVEPTAYSIGLLLDPCRGHAFNCCIDRFGEPAYMDPTHIAEKISLVDESGATLDMQVSRIGDRPSTFDQSCYLDDDLIPFRLQKTLSSSGVSVSRNYTNSGCIGRLQGLVSMEKVVRPACWDYNDSVNALDSCHHVDGRKGNTCVAVGYMQTSYIVQCGGAFELSNHCGTFLELHEPDNEVILSQTRLMRQYPNGFRTTTLPLFFRGDRARTVCMGDYEIWWVQRTRSNFIVQKKKKFRITFPLCDFDFATNIYKNYHQIQSSEISN